MLEREIKSQGDDSYILAELNNGVPVLFFNGYYAKSLYFNNDEKEQVLDTLKEILINAPTPE